MSAMGGKQTSASRDFAMKGCESPRRTGGFPFLGLLRGQVASASISRNSGFVDDAGGVLLVGSLDQARPGIDDFEDRHAVFKANQGDAVLLPGERTYRARCI